MFQPFSGTRYIDPSNVTGGASDSNTGVNPTNSPPGTGPILTTVHLNALLYARSLTGNTTITYLSNDVSGVGLLTDTVNRGLFTLNFVGTPQVVHTGGAINAGTTAISPSTNQRQTVHTSDLTTFAPYVLTALGGSATLPTRLVDTTTNSSAWIVSATTPATPSMSRPVSQASFAAGALTIGDPYEIVTGSVLTLAASGEAPNNELGSTSFTNFAFTAASGEGPLSVFTRCSFDGSIATGGSLEDCFATNGCVAIGVSLNMDAGVLYAQPLVDEVIGPFNISSDIYITGDSFVVALDQYANIFLSPGIGAGIQLQDTTGSGAMRVQVPTQLGPGPGLIWGTGNAEVGILIDGANVGLSVPNTAGSIPTVTGTAGDFGFIGQGNLGLITVARAWDDTAGAYTEVGGVATRTTTWAHLVATIGAGGFNNNAHNVATNASVTTVS
jgi:hypothetical protein